MLATDGVTDVTDLTDENEMQLYFLGKGSKVTRH